MNCSPHLPLIPSALILALGLTGCSSEPATPPEKKVEKQAAAPAPVTGQKALFEIYKVARQWSGDVKVLELENIPLDSVKAEPGKYGAWSAVLTSPTKKTKRAFTYSVIEESATLHKDVFAQAEQPYTPNPQAQDIAIQDVKIDTDKALDTAQKEKDTAEYEKKNPGTPVQYKLEWTNQTQVPAWRVIYGRSLSTSGYSVYVSATDGRYLKKAR